MREKCFLIISLLFVSSSLFSQLDFRKAYIITNSNDTIYGLADYRGDIKNCNKCVFKADELNEPKVYFAADLKAYRFIDSKYYISYYIEDISKKVFIEYLIDGIVDIYYYKDLSNEFYFASKEGSELYKLDNELREIVIDNKKYEKHSNSYINILRYLFSDSDMKLNTVNQVRLDHKPLINIANDYHNRVCFDNECVVFEKKMPPLKVEYSILVFTDFASISVGGVDHYTGLNNKNNIGYSLGLGLSTFMPRIHEKISFYSQLLYCNNSQNSSYNTENIFGSYLTNYQIEIQYLNTDLGFKYTLPKRKMQYDFFIAFAYNIILESSANRSVEEENLSGVITNYEYTDNVITNAIGIAVGAEIDILKLKEFNFGLNIQYNYTYGRNVEGSYGNVGKYASNFSDFTNNMSLIRLGLSINY